MTTMIIVIIYDSMWNIIADYNVDIFLYNPQEENVLQHLAKTLSKEEIEANFKKAPYVNLLERRRKQAKENSAANRFKVINYHRSLDTSNVEEFEDKVMTFIDIEDSVSLTINQNTTEEEQVCDSSNLHKNYVFYKFNVNNIAYGRDKTNQDLKTVITSFI